MNSEILIDTSIMLHDFLFRNPSLENQTANPIAQKVRTALHECLQLLALQENSGLCVPQYCLYRLLGVLSDLQIPQPQIRQEMLYWIDNCRIFSTDTQLLEEILEQTLSQEELEDKLLIQIATNNSVRTIFSVKPRFENYTHNPTHIVNFVWPEKLLLLLK